MLIWGCGVCFWEMFPYFSKRHGKRVSPFLPDILLTVCDTWILQLPSYDYMATSPYTEDSRVKILGSTFLNLKYNFHTVKYTNRKCTAWRSFMYVPTHVTTG